VFNNFNPSKYPSAKIGANAKMMYKIFPITLVAFFIGVESYAPEGAVISSILYLPTFLHFFGLQMIWIAKPVIHRNKLGSTLQ
jgi:hypothetical protein